MIDIKNKKIHFIAIGGVGMSGLAKYLLENGYKVSGSDVQDSKYIKMLKDLGAEVSIGHKKENIQENSIIVASTAIKDDNVEILRAKELNLPILHRSDLLQLIAKEFSDNKKSIFFGFSGTHGKTTTSGLCSYLLEKGGYKPSYVVGGIVPELNDNAKFGSENYFVAELDESDGTILKYQPDVSIINNLELDHIDFYTNGFEDLLKTFDIYLKNLNEGSKVLINTDCEGNRQLIKRNPQVDFITFGINKNADYVAKNISFENFGSSFEIHFKGIKIAELKLTVPGTHNIYNALGVFAALKEAEIDTSKIIPHFSTFSGMGRRFQQSADFNNIKIIDDYAHHPSEIKTTLESVKKSTDSRIVAIFQPHRYSRLKGLWDEFMTSFESADKLIVLDVFAASESRLEEANSERFVNSIKHQDATYIGGKITEIADKILPLLAPSDIVLTLGAGDITKLGSLIEKEYKQSK